MKTYEVTIKKTKKRLKANHMEVNDAGVLEFYEQPEKDDIEDFRLSCAFKSWDEVEEV